MSTQLDRALNQRNLILAFAGVVTAVTAYSIWNGDLFPKLTEPTGDPEKWSDADMRRWLKNRNLMSGSAEREELIAMVQATIHAPT
ncbi:hypothetical protein BDY17DRAFT_348198 [Neohortaea acidophila]|uniref:STE24 endopeptidase n=1 Tax=Neohortaea acidophila TaxID=245834 RepID=A0A6A6PKV8_9PEZI|nr:uncharacterized protein BDY17DRAFT_348198 [Neohortaea acidophila]KAF2480659.1 hypothetical protein BDY17DRAFT_348198 [Neohortaea acidophila]